MTDAPPLKLIPKANAEVDADIVEVLELWLEKAKAGALDGLAIVSINRDGTFSSTFSQNNSRTHLLGALAHVQHKISRQIEEEA